LELLATGAFSPLETLLGREDYEHVLEEMRLSDGTLFSIPLTLAIGKDSPSNSIMKLHCEILTTTCLPCYAQLRFSFGIVSARRALSAEQPIRAIRSSRR